MVCGGLASCLRHTTGQRHPIDIHFIVPRKDYFLMVEYMNLMKNLTKVETWQINLNLLQFY